MGEILNSADKEYVFEWPAFPKEQAESELNISEVAMREGADGFPESDSTFLSITENEIVGRIRRFYIATLDRVSQEFLRFGEETANIKIFLERFDIGQMPFDLKAKVESELTEARVIMNPLVRNAKVALNDLEIFKTDNGLTREPIYSLNWRKIWGPLLLAFLFFFEVILNGALVTTVVDGFIAGIAVSVTVATLNVILSFVIGRILVPELKVSRSSFRKFGAALGLIIHSLLILYVNFVFGVFRGISLSSTNIRSWEDIGAVEVMSAIKPWESIAMVNDVPSLFVIGVGIVFALIALLDGYHYDDSYPGYGDVHRNYVGATESLEQTKKDFSNRILRITKDSLSHMENELSGFEKKMTRWETMMNVAQQQFAIYVRWVNQIEQDANKLLHDYRSANLKGRHSSYTTQKAPGYFESDWSFSDDEKNPDKSFSHLSFLVNTDKSTFENKSALIRQDINSTRDECVLILRKFLQEVDGEVGDK